MMGDIVSISIPMTFAFSMMDDSLLSFPNS